MELVPAVEMMRRWAAARPDAPAATVAGQALTRGALELHGNRTCHGLEARGVKEGDIIALRLPNSLDLVQALVGTLKAGAIPLPLPPQMPAPEVQAIVEVARPALLVGGGPAAIEDVDYIDSVEELSAGHPEDTPLTRVSPGFKAPLSGGSTGTPKVIVSTTPAMVDMDAPPPFFLRREEPVHTPGPLYQNAPLMLALLGLFHGCHVVLSRRFDPAETLDVVRRFGIDAMLLVPTMMSRILRCPDREAADVSSLRVVVHTGAACPPGVKRAWLDWLGAERVVEIYGGTEGQALTAISGGDWLAHPGSVGRPMMGEVVVLDSSGAPAAPGEVGNVYMRAAKGAPPTYRYLGAEAIRTGDGWETIGDLGHMDADGYLYLADRRTDLIVIGGANIYPAEVEAALDDHPEVRSSCVIGLPDDDLGQLVHAIVETAGDAVTADQLREHVARRLVGYKVPRSFELVNFALRDEAGKLRRSALRSERTGAEVRA